MVEISERWIARLAAALSGLNWLFLTLGSIGALLGYPSTGWVAIGSATVYVLGFQVLPRDRLRSPIWREVTALIATIAATAAVVLTGGFESPFQLLAITPVMVAALTGGYRLGFATAGLSAAMIIAFEVPTEDFSYTESIAWLGLLFLVAATFSFSRRLLIEATERVEALTQMTAATGARLEQLENTNILLRNLVTLADPTDLTPSAIGAVTLESIRSAVPNQGAEIYMQTDETPILVASAGLTDGTETIVPIAASGRAMGSAHIFTDRSLTQRQIAVVSELLLPTAVAFNNAALVEEIAATAIRDERLRVARELHDGFGPNLAALGLAIDVAAMNERGEMAGQLTTLRESVTNLVTDVRSVVANLRSDHAVTALKRIRQAISGAQTSVTLDLIELEPIPETRGDDIIAIIVEAIRNALIHSECTQLTISGFIEGDRGRALVTDNGIGFNPENTFAGHYGIVGMHERAKHAGANLSIDSTPMNGTTVLIQWHPR